MANEYLTFNGFDYSANGKDERRKSDVAIIGAPFDLGSTYSAGQRLGPSFMRFTGVIDELTSNVHNVAVDDTLKIVDTGNVEFSDGDLRGGWDAVHKRVSEVYANTRAVLLMGGDQTVSAQAVKALARVEEPLTIFHFDAHGDYWKPEPGVEMNNSTWVRWCIDNGVANRVVQFGVRGWGITKQDRAWAEKNDITTYHAATPRSMERLIEEIDATSDAVYLSVDLDVLDPAFAPGVAMQEPGGLTSRELLSMIQMVASSGKMVGGDITELVPEKDVNGMSVKVAATCLLQMLTGLACSKA